MKPCSLASTALIVGVSTALASTDGFVVPPFRGSPGSTMAGWDNFPDPLRNFPDLAGSTALTAQLYPSPNSASFDLEYFTDAPLGLVTLQTRTVGSELDYSTILLTYTKGYALTAPRIEIARTPGANPGSGETVISEWTWDLTGKNANRVLILAYGPGPHTDLDSLVLDVQTTPEPRTWGLLVCGLLVGTCAYSRRQ